MVKNDKPETLIQLLASYRHAHFPMNRATPRELASLATTIHRNCALTVHFAGCKLRNLDEEGEEVFALFSLREEATVLKGRCARLVNRRNSKNLDKEVASLRQQYDNLTDSVTHMFHLLDRSLTRQLDGVL
jgi:hypothetical protein